MDYPFSTRRFQLADGHSISYLDQGTGPVIVMVHGNPTWSYYYRNLVRRLQSHFRLIVPDHLGCGFSDKPQDYPYTLANHIDNLDQLLAHLGIEGHALVIHDWGGAIGMGYAVRHPRRIKGIMVLNTAAFISDRIPLRIRICRWPFIGAFLVRGLNVFAWGATKMAVKNKMDSDIARDYLAPYDNWANRVAVHRFVRDIPLTSSHISWDVLAEIDHKISCFSQTPMMIAWGGGDFCFNDHFFKQWRRRFPRADYHYLENAGHYILEDGAELVEQLAADFFSKIFSSAK